MYDVSIIFLKNYVVGVMGDLQNEVEMVWLNQKVVEGVEIVGKLLFGGCKVSVGNNEFFVFFMEWKILCYKQQNVYDFGWFVDKCYIVLKGEVEFFVIRRKVIIWMMFIF